MSSRLRRALLAALALVASNCHSRQALEQAAASPEGRFARETLDLVLRRDLPAVVARMSPDVAALLTPEIWATTLGEIPEGSPSAPLIVGADSFERKNTHRSQFVYEYPFPAGYLLGDAVVDSSGPRPMVVGLHLKRMPESVVRLNAFTWRGKSARHFVMLAGFVANAALVIYALVACVRTRRLRRKWLWLAIVTIGLGHITFNWATGQHVITPLPAILQARVYKTGYYAPWILSFTIPVGALVFLGRDRLKRAAAPREAPPSAFE